MSANLNTSLSGTHSAITSPQCINPTTQKIGETFAYCLLSIVSLAGNIFMGITVYSSKTLRKPIKLFIANMAISDLLYPIFLFPINLTQLYRGQYFWSVSGRLGETLCKLVPFLADASNAVSILSVVLIAMERYRAVVFPFRSPLGSKFCALSIIATWTISMALYLPYLFAFSLMEHLEEKKCKLQWKKTFEDSFPFETYICAGSILIFFIPLFVTILLYVIIILKLKSQMTPGEQSANAVTHRAKRDWKVLKMSIAIVMAFIICRIPYTISYFMAYFPPNTSMIKSCGFQYFAYTAFFLAHSHCAINPCICFICCRGYRKDLKQILKKSFHRKVKRSYV